MNDLRKTKQELVEEVRALRETLQLQKAAKDHSLETNRIASAMDAILAIDKDQNIIQFNTAAEHIFGYKTEEVLGKSVHILLPEHVRGNHREHIQNYAETGVSLRSTHSLGTLTGLRANGEVFPIEISISSGTLEPVCKIREEENRS